MEWFFYICNPVTGLVLDASDPTELKMARKNPSSPFQKWSKGINHSVYCKAFGPNRILDLHWHDFNRQGWGKVYLHNDHHGGGNQKWTLGQNIKCGYQNLSLDVYQGSKNCGAKVGCYPGTGGDNQKWVIEEA